MENAIDIKTKCLGSTPDDRLNVLKLIVRYQHEQLNKYKEDSKFLGRLKRNLPDDQQLCKGCARVSYKGKDIDGCAKCGLHKCEYCKSDYEEWDEEWDYEHIQVYKCFRKCQICNRTFCMDCDHGYKCWNRDCRHYNGYSNQCGYQCLECFEKSDKRCKICNYMLK